MLRKHARIVKDTSLGDRQIRIIVSDATPDRVGDVMVPEGCDWSEYRNNPIVRQHEPDCPLGNAQVKIRNSRIEALIDFAPAGISAKVDECCGLAKAGVISAASVGFDPAESEPLAGGGRRYTKWSLLEVSLCAVPLNPSATVIERSAARARARTALQRTPAERQRAAEIDEKDRTERAHRQGIRAEGLAELTGTEFDKYFAAEFPGLGKLEARKAYRERTESMDRSARFAERVRRSDFAREHRRIEGMTPEEYHEHRRREVERLAPPPPLPYRWDPTADAATNMFHQRQSDWRARW